eukprot:Seg3165.2 transcript_id=Seg3165.2/GoldUCD/mRNA.D3Y31 product="hypothetical protein" protein_id=Seg3165.2/GoldUCD/D3Y31
MGAPLTRGHAIGGIVIGVMELLFGLIIMICSFTLGSKIKDASGALTPYWAGIPYLIPGILGIVSGVTKNSCAMIAFMVLNIICFVVDGIAAVLLFLILGIWIAVASEIQQNCTTIAKGNCRCVYKGKTYYYKVDDCGVLKTILAMLWCIVIFAIFAAFTSLAGSILGCCATCCRKSEPQTVIVQTPMVVAAPGQQAPPAYAGDGGYPVKH